MKISTPYGKSKIYSTKSHTPEAQRVLVIPGYSETLTHNRKLVDALASRGFDAATFSQPRRTGKDIPQLEDPIQRQGSVIVSLMEATIPRGETVHTVAHSLGTAAVLRAAQETPEYFTSITLMQPPGMVGKQNFEELAGRVSKKVINNQIGAVRGQHPDRQPKGGGYTANIDVESSIKFLSRVTRAQLAGAGVLAIQPALALKEALAAGTYEIAEDITKVAELGIPVHLVTANNDELYDHDKVHASYEAGVAATSYSSVADRNARHDTFWMQPERTATIVEQLLLKV